MNTIKKLCELQRDLFIQVAEDNGILYPYEDMEEGTSIQEEVKQITEEFTWLVDTLNEGSEDDTVIGGCYCVGAAESDDVDEDMDGFWDDPLEDEYELDEGEE